MSDTSTNKGTAKVGVGQLNRVIIDVADLDRAAAFWSGMLGYEAAERRGPYRRIDRPGGISVVLQEVPEPKAGKNRVHLDFDCDDLDVAMGRVEELGGRKVRLLKEDGWSMIVAADTEGNEFCLVPGQG